MQKLLTLGLLFLCVGFFSCDTAIKDPTPDQVQQAQTQRNMKEATRQVGMPAVVNYQEMKNLKWIYELCDQEKFVCYAYFFNQLKGELGQYIGKCVGYGIPYSTQFSNPERTWMENDLRNSSVTSTSYNDVGGTIPQPEPNGLFKPEGLSATWLLLINPETNEVSPVYIEPLIVVSPFKLH